MMDNELEQIETEGQRRLKESPLTKILNDYNKITPTILESMMEYEEDDI